MNRNIIETAERIVIDYANLTGRDTDHRATFRELVIKHLTTAFDDEELVIQGRLDGYDAGKQETEERVKAAIHRWTSKAWNRGGDRSAWNWTPDDEIEASIMSYIEGDDLKQ